MRAACEGTNLTMTDRDVLFEDKMDRLDIAQIVNTTPWWTRIVVRLSRRQFNRVAYRIVARAYERGHVSSHQMHFLLAQFDPTQKGVVGSL